MKVLEQEAKQAEKEAEKEDRDLPKILTLEEERKAIINISYPIINLMMETPGAFTKESVEMLQLRLAAENGFILIMQLLLTTGKADVNRADFSRCTALDFAMKARKEKMVTLLKKHGAISGQDKEQQEQQELFAVDPSGNDELLDDGLAPLAGEGGDLE